LQAGIGGKVIEGLMSGLSGVGAAVASVVSSVPVQGGGTVTPFGGIFQSMVEQTSALDAKASQAVTGLLSGQGVEIHDAMIATEKADMAFELALQVRNKAVGAYQQMMGMQF
jgi:flagellar hook-basal body complex protein FliE